MSQKWCKLILMLGSGSESCRSTFAPNLELSISSEEMAGPLVRRTMRRRSVADNGIRSANLPGMSGTVFLTVAGTI